jgi:hypothetical protein
MTQLHNKFSLINELYRDQNTEELHNLYKRYFLNNYEKYESEFNPILYKQKNIFSYTTKTTLTLTSTEKTLKMIVLAIEHLKKILKGYRYKHTVCLLPESFGKHGYQIDHKHKWIYREFLQSMFELEDYYLSLQKMETNTEQHREIIQVLPPDIVPREFITDFDVTPILPTLYNLDTNIHV